MDMRSDIKTNLGEVGWCCVDWIDIIEDRGQRRVFVSTVMNRWVPYNVGKFLSS
jgi:hypothetical protein